LGVNTVSYMARLIPELEAYPFPWQESALLGGPSSSVNVIQGGNKVNVVPDLCELEVDLRTVPGQDHQEMVRMVRSVAERVAGEYNAELRIEVGIDNDKPPIETDRSEALVEAIIAAGNDDMSIACTERLVGDDIGMSVAVTFGLFTGDEVVGGDVA